MTYFNNMTYVDVFDVFWTTAERTKRVSNLQLPYNGVLAAFRELVYKSRVHGRNPFSTPQYSMVNSLQDAMELQNENKQLLSQHVYDNIKVTGTESYKTHAA